MNFEFFRSTFTLSLKAGISKDKRGVTSAFRTRRCSRHRKARRTTGYPKIREQRDKYSGHTEYIVIYQRTLVFNGLMRALVQRVSEASVLVEHRVAGHIGRGLLVFLGVRFDDTPKRAGLLARKVVQLRIFPDEEGRMNRSLIDISGELLIVSQFTLYGDTNKGNRPSYSSAAKPELARPLYDCFIEACRSYRLPVWTGIFQAYMEVRSVNDGPVTLMCDSEP